MDQPVMHWEASLMSTVDVNVLDVIGLHEEYHHTVQELRSEVVDMLSYQT